MAFLLYHMILDRAKAPNHKSSAISLTLADKIRLFYKASEASDAATD